MKHACLVLIWLICLGLCQKINAQCITFTYDSNGNRETVTNGPCTNLRDDRDPEVMEGLSNDSLLVDALDSEQDSTLLRVLTLNDTTVEEGNQVSVNEQTNSLESITVFPNPVTSFLNVKIDGFEGGLEYLVFDVNGRQIKSGDFSAGNSVIDFSSTASGDYILQISDKNQTKKVFQITVQ